MSLLLPRPLVGFKGADFSGEGSEKREGEEGEREGGIRTPFRYVWLQACVYRP